MTEFTAEQIKDIKIVNIVFSVDSMMMKAGESLRKVGDALHGTIQEMKSDGADSDDIKYLEGLLEATAYGLQAISKGMMINDIATDLTRPQLDELPEEIRAEIKAQVSESDEIKQIGVILRESAEEAMVRTVMEMLAQSGPEISAEDMEKHLNGK